MVRGQTEVVNNQESSTPEHHMKELAPRCFDDLDRAVLPRVAFDLRLPHGEGHLHLELEQDAFNGGISGVVYDASIRLAQYLADGGLERELQLTDEIQHGSVLELGCGVGLVGMVAAALGSKAVLTDRSLASIELAKTNIRINGLMNYADAVQWSWGSDPEELIETYGPFQLLIASDVVYREELVPPLLTALRQLLVPGNLCLMAYSLRNSAAEQHFATAAHANGIKLCRVDAGDHYDTHISPGVTLRRQVHIARLSLA